MQREVKRLWFVISILVVAPQSRCQPNLHLCGQDKWQTYRRRATGPARKLRQRLTKGLDHNPPTFKSSILHGGHLSKPASFMLCSFLFFFFFLFLRMPGRPGGPERPRKAQTGTCCGVTGNSTRRLPSGSWQLQVVTKHGRTGCSRRTKSQGLVRDYGRAWLHIERERSKIMWWSAGRVGREEPLSFFFSGINFAENTSWEGGKVEGECRSIHGYILLSFYHSHIGKH